MEPSAWTGRVDRYREQGRPAVEIEEIRAYLEQRGPRTREGVLERAQSLDIVTRPLFVARESEGPYLARDDAGDLLIRLVDAGDRLAIWSAVGDGALLNPKSAGLRGVGLVATYARGSAFNESAFRIADLRKGMPVEVRRDAANAHDPNAVALHAPGARKPFGFVQRGRAPAVARRLDAGEDLAAVSMRGPGRGRDDDVAFLLVGSVHDLRTMLG